MSNLSTLQTEGGKFTHEKKKRFVEWNSWSRTLTMAVDTGEWAFFNNIIIYLVFAQTLPLTTCFVFDKFFLRFLPVIESCFGFIWQMTSTKKTFQSIQRRSQEVNVVQADFNAVFTSAKTVIIVLTAREACFISSVFPWKTQRKWYGFFVVLIEMIEIECETTFNL